jgi:hypothetical protein
VFQCVLYRNMGERQVNQTAKYSRDPRLLFDIRVRSKYLHRSILSAGEAQLSPL